MKRIRILYTIPNFDTAGSGLALLKLASSLDEKYFEPIIACIHDKGDLFKSVKKSGIKTYIIDLHKKHRPILNMLIECYDLSKVFKQEPIVVKGVFNLGLKNIAKIKKEK